MNDYQISMLAAAIAIAVAIPLLFGCVGDTPAKKRENFAAGCLFVLIVAVVSAVVIGLIQGIEWVIRFFMGGAA